jgi:hypothetical protein
MAAGVGDTDLGTYFTERQRKARQDHAILNQHVSDADYLCCTGRLGIS